MKTSRKHNEMHFERTSESGGLKPADSLVLPIGDSGHEIHLGSGDPLGLVPKLVPKEHAKEEWDRKVVCDERGRVPVTAEEDPPVGEEDDDDGPAETPPSGEWREPVVPREVPGVDPLGLQALSESDTGQTDTEPVEHSRDGAHVGEPVEDGARGL